MEGGQCENESLTNRGHGNAQNQVVAKLGCLQRGGAHISGRALMKETLPGPFLHHHSARPHGNLRRQKPQRHAFQLLPEDLLSHVVQNEAGSFEGILRPRAVDMSNAQKLLGSAPSNHEGQRGLRQSVHSHRKLNRAPASPASGLLCSRRAARHGRVHSHGTSKQTRCVRSGRRGGAGELVGDLVASARRGRRHLQRGSAQSRGLRLRCRCVFCLLGDVHVAGGAVDEK